MSERLEPKPELKELRVKARLAWNNWPDNEAARKAIESHELRDSFSACAWDRVIEAIIGGRTCGKAQSTDI